MTDTGAPIAWMALDTGTLIYSSDDTEIGKVNHIIADREKDIFSGITFRPGLLETALFIPATAIESMTENAVRLSLSKNQVEDLEPYGG